MKNLGVIPARLGSTRLERKPLQPLLNKPLILWVCEAVQKSKALDKFVVATDSEEILDVVTKAGFEAQMTSINCASGTDRALEVAKLYKPEFIVNIQGDEPLIQAQEIDGLLDFIKSKNNKLCWATLGHKLSSEDLDNKNSVKVVFNQQKEALYFSRFPIPYSRKSFIPDLKPNFIAEPHTSLKFESGQNKNPDHLQTSNVNPKSVLKHVGLYAYTYEALDAFCQSPPCELELAESLEQLRALDLGIKIFVKTTDYESIGVDTMDDLKKVEQKLME